jgi:hypothetical protein
MMYEGEVSIHSWWILRVWGVFSVAPSLGINMIIVVTGVMTRCQRRCELRGCFEYRGHVGLG